MSKDGSRLDCSLLLTTLTMSVFPVVRVEAQIRRNPTEEFVLFLHLKRLLFFFFFYYVCSFDFKNLRCEIQIHGQILLISTI